MSESPQPNSGGAAPADRQCHYTLSSGQQCRNWAVRGHQHCHPHHRYILARPDRPIDVPLLEDSGSIVYVLSQTLQSLAWGTIPVSNGRMMLTGCRLAHTMETTRLEMARLRLRARRMGMSEQELFADPPAEQPEPALVVADSRPQQDARRVDPSTELPIDAAPEPVPVTNPVKVPPKGIRFRDLRTNWNKEMIRSENAAGAVYARRPGETQEEFMAARATPFDHLAAVDREVDQARIQAQAAQQQASADAC